MALACERKQNRDEPKFASMATFHQPRHNLTVRTLMKLFTRLSLGFSKKLENLEAAFAMFLAFYNFVWRGACFTLLS